jgi:hypothetical protein
MNTLQEIMNLALMESEFFETGDDAHRATCLLIKFWDNNYPQRDALAHMCLSEHPSVWKSKIGSEFTEGWEDFVLWESKSPCKKYMSSLREEDRHFFEKKYMNDFMECENRLRAQ